MKLKEVLIFSVMMLLVMGCDNRSNKKTMQVNNQTCPVTGNCVNDHDTYTYHGKEYKLCSEECKKALSEAPEKYLSE